MKYEADIQGKIARSLKDWGWPYIKHQPGFGSCPSGWPDLTVYLPGGRVVLLEVKRPHGKVEPIQGYWITELRRLGHMVFVVDNHGHAVRVLRSVHERPGHGEEAGKGGNGTGGAGAGGCAGFPPGC